MNRGEESKSASSRKNRIGYAAATVSVIGLGLASRKWPGIFPAMLGNYPGDAFWALMVFFGLRTLNPAGSIRALSILALCIAYSVELSQIYQAPWINAIRSTTPGHLILGNSFSWMDLLAYAVGVAFGALSSLFIRGREEGR